MDIQIAIEAIRESIGVLNEDYTQLAVDVGVLKSQVASILWWFRITVGGFAVLIISQLWQVILLKKNNKK